MSRARVVLAAALLWAAAGARAETPSVLFLGNSVTAGLREVFASIAASLGNPFEVDSCWSGSYTLEMHAKDPAVLARVASRRWSFVVLQEQSSLPSFPAEETEVHVMPYAAKLEDAARQVGARVVFYETWGHKYGDQLNCGALPAVCTYDGMQDRLNATYEELARRGSALLAPVGEAWRAVRRRHPEIELYADGVHPTGAGNYLAACVIYCEITHRGVIRADPLFLDRRVAAILQNAAQDAVFARGRAVK